MTTLIENGTVLAWDGDAHYSIEYGVVAFDGDRIVYVGKHYEGQVDDRIDATGRIVMPGFVNAHLHLTDTNFTKGYLEDNVGPIDRSMKEYSANLYRALPAVRNATDPDAQVAAAVCAIAELLRCGSTSIVEMSFDEEIMGGGSIEPVERVAEAMGTSGVRGWTGPRYRKYYYREQPNGEIAYKTNPGDGRPRFEACKSFVKDWNGLYDDRLTTFLAPGQIDTCDPELLRATRAAADELGVLIQLHAGQSVQEYRLIRETHSMTSVEYMADTGLLGPDFIIGHGQWMSESGDHDDMKPSEIELLRDTGTSVAHLPWCKARRGGVINSIQKYRRMGIKQALGTDTFPYDMFNEMRIAATVCKIVEGYAGAGLATEVFEMATVGGADALGRPDLGRLAAGCKADIVLTRIDTPKATPVYDPFLFLVLAANGEDVDRVIVDGKTVVKDGEVQTIDVQNAVADLNEAAARVRPLIKL